MKSKPSLRGLEKKIGYVFSNEALLSVALTHKSYSRDNNERLEFIGDAVLGYVIATDLFELHPKVQEDALSLMRVALVRGNILAEVAEEIGLSEYLCLGTGELKSGEDKDLRFWRMGWRRLSVRSTKMEVSNHAGR